MRRAAALLGWAALGVVAAVGVLLALVALLASAPFTRPFVASRAVKILDDAIAGRVALKGIAVLSRGGIEVHGLDVYDPHDHLVLSVGTARLFVDLTGLRHRAVGISVELESPSVLLEEEADGGVSLARAFAPAHPSKEPKPAARETGAGWTVHLSRLAVRNGDVWWVDPEGATRLEASGLEVDGRGLYGPNLARVDLRLRGALAEPVQAPVSLELLGGLTGDAARLSVLRAGLGETSLAAVAEGSLARRAGRLAVTRVGIDRSMARALAPETPAGDDLAGVAYVESDGAIATAAVTARPAAEGARGRADVAVAARLSAPAAAAGFDVALEAFDPARLVASAPRGDVTLGARGAVAGRSLGELRGRLDARVARSRLRRGEVTRAEIVARADRGTIEVSRAVIAAPGLAVEGALRWREGGAVSGRTAVSATDLGAALANLGGLLGEKLDVARGSVHVAATLSGTSAAPALAGTVDAPLLRLGGVSLSGVRLEGSASGPSRTATAKLSGVVGLVRASGDDLVRTVAVHAALDDEAANLQATATVPGFRDPAALAARGLLGPGRTSLRLSELAVAWPGTRWTLAAPATVLFRGPTVDRLALASGDQRVVVSGGLLPRGKLDVHAELAAIDLARLPAGLLPADAAPAGTLSADVRATGRAARPDVAATLTLSGGAWRAVHGLSASGEARYAGEDRRVRLSLAASRQDGGAADVDADLPVPLAGRGAAPLTARVRVRDLPVEEALAAAGSAAPLAGRLTAEATLGGSVAAPSLRATAALADARAGEVDGLTLDLALEDPGERLRATARVALASGGVVTADAQAPLDLADLLASPARALRALRAAPLDGSVRVAGLEVAPLARKAGGPRRTAGTIDGSAAVTGSLARPRGRASFTLARGAVAGVRNLGATLELSLSDVAIALTGTATAGGAEALRLDASLGLPPERLASPAALRAAPLRAEAVVSSLPLQRIATEEVPLSGTLSARLTAGGTPRAPQVELTAEGADVALGGRPIGAARADARYAGARSTAEVSLRPTAGGTLHATLALEADLGLGAPARPLGEAPAEVAATAEGLDLGFLPALAPDLVRSAAGRIDADVRARGPLARLSPRGTVRVQGGAIGIVEYGDFGGIALDASVGDDAVELTRLEVRRGSGHVSASGWLRGLTSERARLEAHLTSDRFTLVRAGMDVATVDVQVDATGTYADRTLAIEARIPRALVVLPARSPRTLQPLERRKDIVVGRREVRRRARAAAPSNAPPVAVARPLAITAHVVAPKSLQVKSDNPKIDVELKADVRYERAGGEDYAQGAIEAVRGRVEPIGGRIFEIEHGKVQFTGGPPTAAMLDVQARYDSPAAVVTVTIEGPLAKPEIRLESRPPMDDAQIAMLIATGRTELKAGAGGVGGTLTGEEAGRAALAAIGTQAFKDLVADKLPLDTVALDPGALRAGKYVTDKIYVGYTRRFEADPERGENPDEVRVEYQITPRWTFESRYGTAQSGGASLIWSRDY